MASTSNVRTTTEDPESSLQIRFNNGQGAQNPSTITFGDQVGVFHGGQDGMLPLISNEMLTQQLINQHQFAKMKIMQQYNVKL